MADVTVDASVAPSANQLDGVWGPYWTSPSVGYKVYHVGSGLVVKKTTDSGATWTEQDSANNPSSATTQTMAVYWDQENKGDSGALLHIAYCRRSFNDVQYVTFNTSDDTFGTIRTVDSLTVSSTPPDSDISVCKAKSGRVYVACSGDLDAHTENTDHSMRSSSDNFATNNESEASPYSAEEETVLLLADNAADTDDICAVVYDHTNLDLEFWKFDASANTWSKTAIDTDMSVSALTARGTKRFYDAAIRHSDEHILVPYFSDDDVSTGDFRCADIDTATPTITAKTNLHTNIDDSFYAGILINQQNDDVYVCYIGSDDGLETLGSSVKAYFKKSADGMGTWGTEQTYGALTDDLRLVTMGRTVADAGGRVMPGFYNDDLDDLLVNDGNDVEIAASAGGQTLSPGGIASTEAFGSATLATGAVTVSPGGIASLEAFGAATITTGPVTLSPGSIASAEAFGTAIISVAGLTLSPSGIASLEAFGSATVSTGAVTLSPSGIASLEAFGALQLDLTITASGIASLEAFGTAAISTGVVTLSPSGIASAEAFGSATLATGAVTLSPGGITSAEAFGSATITLAGITLSPSGIASTEAFGTATITAGAVTLSPAAIASLEAFGTAAVTVGVIGPPVIELAGSDTPVIALAASDIPDIALAASDTPVIELEAAQS